MDQTSETIWAKQSDYWTLSNIRGYKGPICGFEKSLKYAEMLINEKLVNKSANYCIQYLLNFDEELLSKE